MAKGKYHRWLEGDGLTLLQGWARRGLTDEQIAHNIGINTTTLYEWKNKYSPISEALKKGKEVVDAEVENALFKRAMGYEYVETMTRYVGDDPVPVETKRTVKVVPPDVTAQIYWLKNRMPKDWRDRKEQHIEVEDGGVVILAERGVEEDAESNLETAAPTS